MNTYLVLGNMRGGTSMVAGLLRLLGVNMGDNIDPLNHEDLDLQHRHPIHMRELVNEKNSRLRTWGWKDPLAIDWIDDLCQLCDLRNPVAFVVFRDIVATAEGLVKYEGWDYPYAFNHVAKQTEKLVSFANDYRDRFPIYLISYERAMANPEDVIRFFADRVDAELDNGILDLAKQFMASGYRELPPPKDRSRTS